MKAIRNAGVAILVYAIVVVLFEAYLGIVQPRFGDDEIEGMNATIVITTTGTDGSTQERVVVPMVSDEQLYVSANHWPRSWYKRALENPELQVTTGDETKDYLAVPIAAPGTEHDRLEREHPHPVWFRFLTGFPPRRFMRLEAR